MGFRYDDTESGGGVTFAPPTGQIDAGDATSEGASGSAARADHQHAFPGPTGAPGAVAVAGAAGDSARPARQDHTHAHTAAHHLAGGHADLTGDFAAITAPGAAVGVHEAAGDPHPAYQLEATALAAADVVLRALVDAKGDLLVGTAADTVARLAAGADGTFLVADSSVAAGLKFAAGPEAGVTDHGALTGLGDNDHPQYLRGSTVRKSADEAVVTNTTLQNDDELLAALAANKDYAFQLDLHVTSDLSPDFKVAITVPTGATLLWHALGMTTSAPEPSGPQTVSGTGLLINYNAAGFVRIVGSVRVAATAGNLRLQWAQNTSSGSPTTVKAGSILRVSEV